MFKGMHSGLYGHVSVSLRHAWASHGVWICATEGRLVELSLRIFASNSPWSTYVMCRMAGAVVARSTLKADYLPYWRCSL